MAAGHPAAACLRAALWPAAVPAALSAPAVVAGVPSAAAGGPWAAAVVAEPPSVGVAEPPSVGVAEPPWLVVAEPPWVGREAAPSWAAGPFLSFAPRFAGLAPAGSDRRDRQPRWRVSR